VATLVVQLLVVFALLVVLAGVLTAADRWVSGRWASGRPSRRRILRRSRRPAPEPMRRPLQVVAADLRRLARQLALVPAGAPLLRWQALWAAYDEVLTEAAQQLEIPHELATIPMGIGRDLERIRVLAALEGAGLVVRG
jgi:hypothetical protein